MVETSTVAASEQGWEGRRGAAQQPGEGQGGEGLLVTTIDKTTTHAAGRK